MLNYCVAGFRELIESCILDGETERSLENRCGGSDRRLEN
jgi:hypothetical protein